MKKLFSLFFLAAFLIPFTVLAAEPSVYFFYGEGCPHCARVEPFIEEISGKYPEIHIEKNEVYKNMENALQMTRMFDKYGVAQEDRGVPVVFLNGTYFLGDRPILDNLENEIMSFKKEIKSFTSDEPVTDPPSAVNVEQASREAQPAERPAERIEAPPEDQPSEIPIQNEPAPTDTSSQDIPAPAAAPPSLWVITGMALVDSINPCAIAVLVILLGALLTVNPGEKKRILQGGLAFTAAIYIAYFLFGLGISFSFQLFQGSSYWIYKAMGVLAIMLGLGNMKDFFWYGGGGFVMEIPRSWRPSLQKILRGVTSPAGAFLAGFAVTLFELPCTGGPYFVVLGLLSTHETIYSIIPLLLYYNVFFVLPLLVITGLIYLGFSNVEKAGLWKDKHIRGLHFVAGTVMVILGVWILFS